jgi:hypothetical protein
MSLTDFEELTEMVNTSTVLVIGACPDRVWNLIGGFHSVPNWHPHFRNSQVSDGGRVRRLESVVGEIIIERLESFDNAARKYSYSMINGPFPASNYRATISVEKITARELSRVMWSGSFTPVGVSEAHVRTLFQEIYRTGLAALSKNVALKTTTTERKHPTGSDCSGS